MKAILYIALLFPVFLQAQRKHVDTVMAGMYCRIDWDTTNTGPTELVFFTPGSGEKGGGTLHDSIHVYKYGPEEFIHTGWNGNVALGNGTHRLMFCTFIQDTLINSSMFTQPTSMKPFFDAFIASRFHQYAKDSAWGLISLSSGAWLGAEYNAYLAGVGDYTYFKYFKWFVDIEGVKPDDTYGSSLPFPQKFGNREHVAKLAFFGFDQIGGLGTSFLIQQNIIDSVPSAKAYNVWTAWGDLGHDSFDSVTNPAATNWTASNPNLRTTNSSIPSVFFAGGQNIYQAAIRTADTSLTSSPPAVNAGGTLTINPPTTSVTLTGSATPTGLNTISSHTWSFVSGPATPTIVSPSNYTTSVTGLSAVGAYKILLSATDNLGSTGTDTAFIIVSINPIANAGGTYNVTQANGSDVTLNGTGSSAPSGHSISHSWHFVGYYIGNDKVTHQTGLNGESQLALVKGATTATPQIIDMKMYCGDSIHTYYFIDTVTDLTSGLKASDTAKVIYRYWNKYPPQNVDGGAGGHVATSGDCSSLPANMQGGCTVGQDWFITGANDDPVKDASGTSHFTSFFQNSTAGTVARVSPGFRIWVNAGSAANGPYCNSQLLYDTAGGSGQAPLGDTSAAQIIITYYSDGTTNLKGLAGFTFQNIRNVRITGDYDSIRHIGLPNYPGTRHSYAYSDTAYGWMVDNHFQSRAGASFQITGLSTQHYRIDHCASLNGNFFGFQLKQEYAGIGNPSTRPQVYWYGGTVDNNLVVLNTGESYYCFSANQPAIQGVNFRFFNNRAAYAGNKSFKVLDQKSGCWIYNNTAFQVSINWPSAFEEDVSVGSEVSVVGSGNRWFNNMIYHYGNQGLNYLTTNFGAGGQVDSVTNNAFVGGCGPIGGYIGQQDSAATLYFTGNIYGRHNFLFNQAYKPGSHGTNTQFQLQALEAASLPSGHTVSTYHIASPLTDLTKNVVYNGNGTAIITGSTVVTTIPWPQFANSGFDSGVLVRQFNDTTFGTFGDEFPRQSDQKDTVIVYQTGEIVHWFGKFYKSLINNNANIPTGATDANWTLMTFSNGGTNPPNDIRLFKTDFYAQKGIGLLDQLDTAGTVSANAGPDQIITLPTSSATLNGTASIGATTYLWTKISGPGATTILNNTTATPTATGLQQGVYVFQLSINSGASTDQVQVTVNAAIVYPHLSFPKRVKLKSP